MANKKRPHPKFLRPNYGRSSRSRIKSSWRRQRGIDNKKRAKIAYMGCSPSIGYGQPSEIKYTHPLGLKEALVQSPKEIAGLKDVLIRIAKGVGQKKRMEIAKLAEAKGLKVLNKKKEVVRAKKEKKGAKPAAVPPKAEAQKPAAAPAMPEEKKTESVHIPPSQTAMSQGAGTRESKKSVNKQGKQGVM